MTFSFRVSSSGAHACLQITLMRFVQTSPSFSPLARPHLLQAAQESRGAIRRQAWLIEGQGVPCLYCHRSTYFNSHDLGLEVAELRDRTTKEGFRAIAYMTYPRSTDHPNSFAVLIEASQERMHCVVEIMTEIARQATVILKVDGPVPLQEPWLSPPGR